MLLDSLAMATRILQGFLEEFDGGAILRGLLGLPQEVLMKAD